jgi:hypothetical protein
MLEFGSCADQTPSQKESLITTPWSRLVMNSVQEKPKSRKGRNEKIPLYMHGILIYLMDLNVSRWAPS